MPPRLESPGKMRVLSRFAFTLLALAFVCGWQARETARRQGGWSGRPVGYGIAAVVLATVAYLGQTVNSLYAKVSFP